MVHPAEAENFPRALAAAGQQVRVAMEASGHARWFARLLRKLHFECAAAWPKSRKSEDANSPAVSSKSPQHKFPSGRPRDERDCTALTHLL
jgi:transposase